MAREHTGPATAPFVGHLGTRGKAAIQGPVTVPSIDLHAGFAELEADIMRAVARVCASGAYVLGPQVEAFE